jgi:hypothetical protein
MDNVRVNGDNFFENIPAMIDSGSNYIFGDWDKVAELYRHLGGTLLEHVGFGYYSCEFRLRSVPCFYRQSVVPCDSFPTLGLTFGGRTFEILPEFFRLEPIEEGSSHCFGAIMAQSQSIPLCEIHRFSLPSPPFTAPDGLVLTIRPSILDHWVPFPGGRIQCVRLQHFPSRVCGPRLNHRECSRYNVYMCIYEFESLLNRDIMVKTAMPTSVRTSLEVNNTIIHIFNDRLCLPNSGGAQATALR